MATPYRTKTYDPGRLIYKIDFYKQGSVKSPSGGTSAGEVLSLSTKAAKDKIFEGNQLVIEVGASVMNEDTYFVIRHRKAWYPEKDMTAVVAGQKYIVRAIIQVNEPVTYLKLLCVKNGELT